MKTIVIGDIHGDWQGLMAILRATGAIDGDNRRVPGTRVIQLGDLIHGGVPRSVPRAGVDDHEALLTGMAYCDEILIGNHELPHLYPDAGFPTFGGQRPVSERTRWMLRQAIELDLFTPATSVGGWLLTHAGLHQDIADRYGFVEDVPLVVDALRRHFAARIGGTVPLPWFDNVGPLRGGRVGYGGIFWADWREHTEGYRHNRIPQIVGHTRQEAGYASLPGLWCVDAGAALSGRVSAIVSDDDGAHWDPLVVESASGDIAAV